MLNSWRGVPVALAMLVAFAVGFDVMLRRTRFGRSIIAIGGNVEAARCAGIPVNRIRIMVFALAAVGGILAVSREFAAHQSTGGSTVLLFAISAAVIGGVSLFGGRRSTYGALLDIAVIGSINSGMYLLELDSSVRIHDHRSGVAGGSDHRLTVPTRSSSTDITHLRCCHNMRKNVC